MKRFGTAVSRFTVRNFFVSQCRKMSEGKPSVLFQKYSGGEKLMDKRGGVSRLSVEKTLSHSAEKFIWEPFCAVSENFR